MADRPDHDLADQMERDADHEQDRARWQKYQRDADACVARAERMRAAAAQLRQFDSALVVAPSPMADSDLADRLAAELDEYPCFMDLMEMQERVGPLADFLDAIGFDHDAELVRRMLFPTGTVADLRAERDEYRRQLDTLRNEVQALINLYPVSSDTVRWKLVTDTLPKVLRAAVGDPEEGRE